MRPAPEQLRYYLDGFVERAEAAIAGEHPLNPNTELAAARQAIGTWEEIYGTVPVEPPRCEACED